jgi:pyruvate dehydrogenase E1 component beta subunit
MNNNFVRIDDMRFVGDGTDLDLTGTMDLNARRVAGLARGSANLGILQGFYRNIRSSGNAQLTAQVSGSLDAPIVRLGGADVPIPYNPKLERAAVPQEDDIVDAVQRLMRARDARNATKRGSD